MNNDKIIQAILKVKLQKWLLFCFSVIRWKAWTQVLVCCPGGETRTGGEICPHQLQPQNQWEKVPQVFIKTWRRQQILLLWKLCAWMTQHYFLTCYDLHIRPAWLDSVGRCHCVYLCYFSGHLCLSGIHQTGKCCILTWRGSHPHCQPWSLGAF